MNNKRKEALRDIALDHASNWLQDLNASYNNWDSLVEDGTITEGELDWIWANIRYNVILSLLPEEI